MRIFLLPISTRRTLIYCDRVAQQLEAGAKIPIHDRIVNKANETWAQWEKSEGMKKKLTDWGNEFVFKRIPFEEWGLKTLPSSKANLGRTKVIFPDLFLKTKQASGVLERLAAERQSLHNSRMWWSLIGLPLTAPIGILPVIPNIPGFYLAFRAYSHWKALYGAKTLEALCAQSLVDLTPSSRLNELYAAGLVHPTRSDMRSAPTPSPVESKQIAELVTTSISNPGDGSGSADVMLLKRWNGKLLAEEFGLPGMELEIERAVEQVEKAISVAAEEKSARHSNEAATQSNVREESVKVKDHRD